MCVHNNKMNMIGSTSIRHDARQQQQQKARSVSGLSVVEHCHLALVCAQRNKKKKTFMIFMVRSKHCCHSIIGFCRGFSFAKNIIECFISNCSRFTVIKHCSFCRKANPLNWRRSVLLQHFCTQFLFEKQKLQLNYFWVISFEQINYFVIDLCVDLASPCARLHTWHIVALRKFFLWHHIGSFGRCCIRWTVFGRGWICIGRWCAFRSGCMIVMLLLSTQIGHFRVGNQSKGLWRHFQRAKNELISSNHWTEFHSKNHWNKPLIEFDDLFLSSTLWRRCCRYDNSIRNVIDLAR